MRPALDCLVTLAWVLCLLSGGCQDHEDVASSSDSDHASETGTSSEPPPGVVPAFAPPRAVGNLPEPITEASGIVQSAWEDDRFWLHNDSGYDPELFAIRQDGTLLATLTLPVPNRDWEDISRGPCAPGDTERACLYIGEIGDNRARHDFIAIHRIAEPRTLDGDRTLRPDEIQTMELVYPDEPHDAESLVVDDNLRIWILTKRPPGVTRLYTAPFVPGPGRQPLEFVREFDLRDIRASAGGDFPTAADWDPDRKLFLLRLYFLAAVFPVPDGDLRTVFNQPPVIVPSRLEPQGEAIAWTRDGGYIHTSEGRNATLWRVDIADP